MSLRRQIEVVLKGKFEAIIAVVDCGGGFAAPVGLPVLLSVLLFWCN